MRSHQNLHILKLLAWIGHFKLALEITESVWPREEVDDGVKLSKTGSWMIFSFWF